MRTSLFLITLVIARFIFNEVTLIPTWLITTLVVIFAIMDIITFMLKEENEH